MEPIYSQKFTVSHIHVDRFGRLTPAAILYFGQEAAGEHCTLLQVDHDTLSHRHLFWAVTRNRVQITRLPQLGETITVETWPMPTTRVAYPRSIVAYDEQGKELFRSISLWVLMDSRTRGMLLPGKSDIVVNGTLTGTELAPPHAIATRPLANTVNRTVGFSLLDRNGHMNNTRYMDWVSDLLPSAFHQEHPVREFTVCYLNEALEGEEIALSYELTPDGVLTVDAQRDCNRIFSVQLQF